MKKISVICVQEHLLKISDELYYIKVKAFKPTKDCKDKTHKRGEHLHSITEGKAYNIFNIKPDWDKQKPIRGRKDWQVLSAAKGQKHSFPVPPSAAWRALETLDWASPLGVCDFDTENDSRTSQFMMQNWSYMNIC